MLGYYDKEIVCLILDILIIPFVNSIVNRMLQNNGHEQDKRNASEFFFIYTFPGEYHVLYDYYLDSKYI